MAWACACLSKASADSNADLLSSNSFWLMAFSATSGARRAWSRRAWLARASATATAASCDASWVCKLAGSIWNRGAPALTVAPSTNRRFCKMPATRARTSVSREPVVWPVYSSCTGSALACTVMTDTSGGGILPPAAPIGPCGGAEGPQATRATMAIGSKAISKWRKRGWRWAAKGRRLLGRETGMGFLKTGRQRAGALDCEQTAVYFYIHS